MTADGESYDAELRVLRERIDAVDKRIVELLAERLRAVLAVGELKRRHGTRVYDPDRERRIISGLVDHAPQPLEAGLVRRVFERIIDESRRTEQHHVRGDEPPTE